MKLIAIKDISSQLPAGAAFEQANSSDANILIAMGVAQRADEPGDLHPSPQPDTNSTDSAAAPPQYTSRRGGRYRTRHLAADQG